ncbi:MAG: DsbA family protein [Candidatus Daviesbacteria bacterium]|nr:MAG: DsbA family protein [Candidatus Daviesbacteria bacterium]
MDDKQSFSSSKDAFLTTPMAILLGSFVIAFAILLQGGVIKLNSNTGITATGGTPAAQTTPSAAPTSAQVSPDDDPVLGDKNAKVTLIEFSDYECPFCKRHFDQVYPSLKKDYIDTGKVKLVYRDYPLPFHDPMATFEAQAASCAREQGGDGNYFKMHDEMFKQTTSNGNGLTKEKIAQIATGLGLNGANIVSCADSNKYKDEVAKDIADGSAVGVSGTPTFMVGKSSGGTIDGTIIVGAQPYSAFQQIIDPLLK